MKTERTSRHINRLLLDPNNYRLIDNPDYKEITDTDADKPNIQKRTLNFILGKDNENVKDLISSFKTNGFLDIDQIQVKPTEDGNNYIVIEGNRRTATLKYLYEEYKKGNDVGSLTESDFKSIPLVVVTDEDPVQHLVTMGLHHIGGKKRWSAVNEAQLINDLIEKHQKTEAEVCDALGISKVKLRRSIRTLNLIEAYKDSDYGDQFKSSMYSIFESVVYSPDFKEWLLWNEDTYSAENKKNLERFFSWISTTEEFEIDSDDNERITKREPIISQYRQIKDVAQFINDEKAIQRMEESQSISEAYSYSDAIGENKVNNALENIKKEADNVYRFGDYLKKENYEQIEKLKEKLDRLIPNSLSKIIINDKKMGSIFQKIENHFSEIIIHQYRKINNSKIKNLSQVNIFAGNNNMGKTTLLESVYLLSQLNNINAFFHLEKYSGKFQHELNAKWLDATFDKKVSIEGVFNNIQSNLVISKENSQKDIDKTAYLNSLHIQATVDNKHLSSFAHLYADEVPELRFKQAEVLCSATFSSPYRNNYDLLLTAHSYAVENKFMNSIIDFIQEHLDSSIEKVEIVTVEDEKRFMVTSNKFDKAMDITKYGEGLQRIFEIALLMIYSQNGIICIDEIDSAIHHSLLIQFTKFIQQLADKFNVQVFLSTHSKECIDAFIHNNYHNERLTAYAMVEEEGMIKCKYVDGKRLESLIESINLDIR